jgi:lipopolysaccharide/colanic/teichoic acid biosynthesis glycosyltransferase
MAIWVEDLTDLASIDFLPAPSTDASDAQPFSIGRTYCRFVKPVIDFAAALVLLVVALPVMLAVAMALRLKMGSGVIYRQARVGRNGSPFTMFKFRTMTTDRRAADRPFTGIDRRVCHKRDDDPRHTPLGRLLRKSSLDELPQLWNVLRGDMSLVGPRPELVEIVDHYEDWQHLRHSVRPGITGFWQISDRAGGMACEGVQHDIDYLQRLSFATDCKVLLRTVPATLRRTGR